MLSLHPLSYLVTRAVLHACLMPGPVPHTLGTLAVSKLNALLTFMGLMGCWEGSLENLDFTPMTVGAVERF